MPLLPNLAAASAALREKVGVIGLAAGEAELDTAAEAEVPWLDLCGWGPALVRRTADVSAAATTTIIAVAERIDRRRDRCMLSPL
jgi:hypothetical protein